MYIGCRAVIIFIFITFLLLSSPCFAEITNTGYMIQPDGSVKYDDGRVSFGIPSFEATDGIKYLTSDYPGIDLVDHGIYWSTPNPSPLSGRFYDDGRIYLGKDTDHYIGMKPVGIFYVNYQDLTERQQLISLTSTTLSVNNNIATYTQGPVDIVFTNSFSRIKGDVIFPNAPPIPTVSNPALAVVWEIVGHAGISTEDGEKSTWWFEEAKAAFPIGDIQNNGSIDLKKKIFRENGKIYLVEGVGYNWISDVNRTDSHFILDPSVEYNSSDNWAGLSGTMLEHGDGNLRAPPNVTTGLVSYWNPGTDVGSGSTLTDIWGVNDGTIHGATWNMTSGMLEYNGSSDYVNCGDDTSLNITESLVLISTINTNGFGNTQDIIGKGWYHRLFVDTDNDLRSIEKIGGTDYDLGNLNEAITSSHTNNFVTMVYDKDGGSNNWNLYSEGILKSSSTKTGTLNSQIGSNLKIGSSSANLFFNGSIGTTYIYSTVLTNTQINETRDNYHTTSSYRGIDTPQDAGAGNVWKHIHISGTDAGANTSLTLQIKGYGDDWQTFNITASVGDNVTIPAGYEYRNAQFRWYSNTTYQPETNIIGSVTFIPAPIYTVNGTIYGAAGLGEGQVTVTLGSDTTTTSSSGSYSFSGISTGTYTITASKPGLQDASTTINVSGDTTQDITMTIAESSDGGGQQSSDWGVEFNISGPISRIDGLFTPLQAPYDPAKYTLFWYCIIGLGVFMLVDGTAFRFDESRNDPIIKLKYHISAPLSLILVFIGLMSLGIIHWNQLGIGILLLGVLAFIDGLAFCVDKSRKSTFLKIKYQVLITTGLGLSILGAVISKLLIFS